MIGLPPFQTREAKRFPILPIGLGSVVNRRKGDSEYWRIYDLSLLYKICRMICRKKEEDSKNFYFLKENLCLWNFVAICIKRFDEMQTKG